MFIAYFYASSTDALTTTQSTVLSPLPALSYMVVDEFPKPITLVLNLSLVGIVGSDANDVMDVHSYYEQTPIETTRFTADRILAKRVLSDDNRMALNFSFIEKFTAPGPGEYEFKVILNKTTPSTDNSLPVRSTTSVCAVCIAKEWK